MAIKLNEENLRRIIKESLQRIISENAENELTAFHGTRVNFDAFDLSFIGKGEGSLQYGYGVYISGNKDTGAIYADIAAFKNKMNGEGRVPNKSRSEYDALRKVCGWIDNTCKTINHYGRLDPEGYVREKIIVPLEKEYKNGFLSQEDYDVVSNIKPDRESLYSTLHYIKRKILKGVDRFLYTVDIPDGPYMNWDGADVDANKQVYAQWAKDFPEKLRDVKVTNRDFKNFGKMYDKVRGFSDGRKATAEQNLWMKDLSLSMAKLGYVGIEVPIGRMQGVNGDGRGMNYIVFDEKNVQITGRENIGKENQ